MTRRLLGRLRAERGFTLIELVVVMAILGIVLGALTTVFVSGTNAELDLNRRYQAQQQARLALDRIRMDIHCASAAQAQLIGTYQGLKLAIGNSTGVGNCPTDPTVSWCVVQVTASPPRYELYRSTATSGICTSTDTTRVLVADYLTTDSNVFASAATIPQNALQTVAVDLPVNVNPSRIGDAYELSDVIVARNSTRCTYTGGCAAPTVS